MAMEAERLFEFEYAGMKFNFCQVPLPNRFAVEMGVLPVTEAAAEFLKDEEYYHQCFVLGRTIWLKQRKGELDV